MIIHDWESVIKYFMDDKKKTILWDYVTGLRGPSSNAESWKKMITCVIRGECGEAYGIATTRSFLNRWIDNEIIEFLSEEMEVLSNHWFNHSMFALNSLAKYYSYKIYDSKISNLLCELSYNLEERFVESHRMKIITIVREIIEELYKEE